MIKKFVFSLVTIVSLIFVSCGSDKVVEPTGTISLNILNLKPLEGGASYEGWLITPSGPISTGKFTSVNFPQKYTVKKSDIEKATQFVVSLEPAKDTDKEPSNTKILSGTFNGDGASLTIENQIGNFNNASGFFVLSTPTDNNPNTMNNQYGIWFMNPGTPKTAGLNLPELSPTSGWKYEGWVIANGIPVSTGTFSNPSARDDFSPFSSNQTDAPNFPGEDFLNSSVAPSGVTFPMDVKGKNVVISIEPNPDNSSKPFFLKPLEGKAGQDLAPSKNTLTLKTSTFPIGTVTRK